MKRGLLLLSLFAVMFTITGCPLMTNNPIDEGSMDVPSWLIGRWESETGITKYRIEKTSGTGKITVHSIDSVGNSKEQYKTTLSNIDGTIFASVYVAGDDLTEEGYYIHKIERVSDKEIIVWDVKENEVSSSSSSSEIKSFLKKHYTESSLYTDKIKLRKK